MVDEIFLLPRSGKPEPLSLSPYESEAVLQQLLVDYPELLRLRLPDGALVPWVLIQREIGVPGGEDESDRWALDHLFIDADAIPTFVEVKRSSDTRARRNVVGQMLDYAANAALHWPVERMRGVFEVRCTTAEVALDPEDVLVESLGSDLDVEAFWGQADENLRAGRIRLLFVGDHLPVELQRIIEFLNRHMPDVEVLGIELPKYAGAEADTIVPRVIGQSASNAKSSRTRSTPGERWNEERFFDVIRAEIDDEIIRIRSRELYDRILQSGLQIRWGSGAEWGSWVTVLRGGNTSYYLLRGTTSGDLNIEFRYMWRAPAFDSAQPDARAELRHRIERALSYSIPDEKVAGEGGIAVFPGHVLRDPTAIDRLVDVVEWANQEIHRYHASSPE